MLGALSYLLLTRLKNQIKSIIKSPVKLIYSILIIALIAFTYIGGNVDTQPSQQYRDLQELFAVCFIFYLMMFVLIANNGFGNGADLFRLSDVNLVFTAPISSSKVLFYGLFRQLGTSLLLGAFILFQYSWLHNLYGVSYAVILIILLGYALILFCAQVLAMIIYSITNGEPNRKRIAKFLLYGLVAALFAWIFLNVLQDRINFIPKIAQLLNVNVFRAIPVIGWVTLLVSGLILGNAANIMLGLILTIIYVGAIIAAVVISKREYYEDVLNTAQVNYSVIAAKKEGKMGEAVPQNVKVGKIGIDKGEGADTFYYKHLVENRRSKLFVINRISVLFAIMIIIYSFFMKSIGLISVFIFATYMQLFSVSLGRMNKELLKQYIYLIPEPSYKKLLYTLKESVSGFVVEAIITFVPVGLILQMTFIDIIFCIIARISFSFLFTAGSVLAQRVFGTMTSKVLIMFFYIIELIIMALPGIILTVILLLFNVIIISSTVTIFLALTLCNLPVAFLVLFLCRNMLEYAELNFR